MRPAVAIEELEKLKKEAAEADHFARRAGFDAWKARTRAIFVRTLGADNNLVQRFDKIRYSLGIVTERTTQSAFDQATRSGVRRACELIDAAIWELGLVGGDEPVDEHAYDPELWAHVKTEVEDGEWGKVASQTAIFVENHIRTWAGNPQDGKGNNLVGKNLYLDVFGDASDYRLGRQASEREGWRYLGMGFAQALSNVDRHRIQTRDDAKRYALGVLGLGSLLLTQLRYEHGDILKTE
ncbi:TIGR02391 family protein [Micromonospora sp. CPCC 205711]|uniref:TIGR02391 family protein n=1 Tax=Micromonospora sp. CPCC 205547 TaxID=3122400 RepID=UPI002FF1E23C